MLQHSLLFVEVGRGTHTRQLRLRRGRLRRICPSSLSFAHEESPCRWAFSRGQRFGNTRIAAPTSKGAEFVSMEKIERRYILHVLKAFGGNRTKTAEVLGLACKTLYRKLQSYGATGDNGTVMI